MQSKNYAATVKKASVMKRRILLSTVVRHFSR
ncbi:hypothetical protein ABIA22_005771 [Sinorhizobium fredii]